MIVDLNDNKFSEAKNGDIFIVEVMDGKKVATPITKDELLKSEIETMKRLQEQINDLKDLIIAQNEVISEQNVKMTTYTTALYKFINIMNGGNTNEKTI